MTTTNSLQADDKRLDKVGPVCHSCYLDKSNAFARAGADWFGFEPTVNGIEWADNVPHYFFFTGDPYVDSIELRSPTWNFDTRYGVLNNLIQHGDVGFTGFAFPMSKTFDDVDEDEVDAFSLRFRVDGDNVVARGYFNFDYYGESVCGGGYKKMLARMKSDPDGQFTDAANDELFRWTSVHLWNMARAVESQMGIWGKSGVTDWAEAEVIHPTPEDVLAIDSIADGWRI